MYEIPIPRGLKKIVKRTIPRRFWEVLKERQRQFAFERRGPYSFDEPAIMRQINNQASINPYFVDIGAQDGVLGSQTLGLAKLGWAGVSYEADRELHARAKARYASLDAVKVMQAFITPDSVVDLMRRDGVPTNFGFLSLDIDSFDYYVLEAILSEFCPNVICVEINEMIPPPIVFKTLYDKKFAWDGTNFQGFSIQAIKPICNKFHYSIGELHYNNLLLIKTGFDENLVKDSDIMSAYRSGYVMKPDRKKLFPWNAPFDHLLNADANVAVRELRTMFSSRLDQCVLDVERNSDGADN